MCVHNILWPDECCASVTKIENILNYTQAESIRSQIHERTISLRFLGIILRFLRLEVSVYNVYVTNQFQTTFCSGGGGGGG